MRFETKRRKRYVKIFFIIIRVKRWKMVFFLCKGNIANDFVDISLFWLIFLFGNLLERG